MAQSPLNSVSATDAADYYSNWDALSTLITRGRSFSGRERHCAFLNTRGSAFANTSGSLGLDLIDDGRSLAVCDWDGDGDLDLWMTQRNGPRLRLLRNDLSDDVHSVSIRLEGTRGNRDAIGARLLTQTSTGRKLTRTVRAGDSFLSQSSKRLHIGLEPDETIDSLTVTWPGSQDPESFRMADSDSWHLVQGTGVAEPEERKFAQELLAASIPTTAESPDTWRLPLMHPKEMPKVKYVDFSGELQIIEPTESPTLVTLWASWCAPCVKELANFTAAKDAFDAKRLRIVALSTDALGDGKADLGPAKDLVAKADYPFDLGLLDTRGAQALSAIHYNTLAVQHPLSLPSSFLIDASGRVGVLYQGTVSAEQVLKDIDLLGASEKVIAQAAFPFPGRNGVEHFTLTPLAFAQAYHAGGDTDAALAYLEEQFSARESTLKEQYFIGTLEQARGRWAAAVTAYEKVLERSPQNPAIRVPLGVALWKTGRKSDATEQFRAAELLTTTRPATWAELGRGHLQLGLCEEAAAYFKKGGHRSLAAKALVSTDKARQAIALYESLLKENPESYQAMNDLAWLLATHTEASIRNAKRALELATQLAKLSEYRDLHALDTLAVALANAGNFDEAIKHGTSARRLARAVGLSTLANEMTARLIGYRNRQPHRRDA